MQGPDHPGEYVAKEVVWPEDNLPDSLLHDLFHREFMEGYRLAVAENCLQSFCLKAAILDCEVGGMFVTQEFCNMLIVFSYEFCKIVLDDTYRFSRSC